VYFPFQMWRPLVSERSTEDWYMVYVEHEHVTHFLSRFESRSLLLAFVCVPVIVVILNLFIKIAIRYNLTNLQQLQFQNMITIELKFSWLRPEAACCLYRASGTLHLYGLLILLQLLQRGQSIQVPRFDSARTFQQLYHPYQST